MGFISSLLDLLFPPKCVFCARVLNKGDDGLCGKCTESLPFADNRGEQKGEYFDFCLSPLYYRGVVRRSVLRFKFGGAQAYAAIYGKLLADCIRGRPGIGFDMVSWVPLSRSRERSRGYDQARLLAMATALELGAAAAGTLVKQIDVRAQSELGGRDERSANISGAYAVPDPDAVAGKCVLLVDDVVTTGSTLDECAKALLAAGAKRVVCASLARSD